MAFSRCCHSLNCEWKMYSVICAVEMDHSLNMINEINWKRSFKTTNVFYMYTVCVNVAYAWRNKKIRFRYDLVYTDNLI